MIKRWINRSADALVYLAGAWALLQPGALADFGFLWFWIGLPLTEAVSVCASESIFPALGLVIADDKRNRLTGSVVALQLFITLLLGGVLGVIAESLTIDWRQGASLGAALGFWGIYRALRSRLRVNSFDGNFAVLGCDLLLALALTRIPAAVLSARLGLQTVFYWDIGAALLLCSLLALVFGARFIIGTNLFSHLGQVIAHSKTAARQRLPFLLTTSVALLVNRSFAPDWTICAPLVLILTAVWKLVLPSGAEGETQAAQVLGVLWGGLSLTLAAFAIVFAIQPASPPFLWLPLGLWWTVLCASFAQEQASLSAIKLSFLPLVTALLCATGLQWAQIAAIPVCVGALFVARNPLRELWLPLRAALLRRQAQKRARRNQ